MARFEPSKMEEVDDYILNLADEEGLSPTTFFITYEQEPDMYYPRWKENLVFPSLNSYDVSRCHTDKMLDG